MREAARPGRFAIVTGGAAWGPMLTRLARALELADRLARSRSSPRPVPSWPPTASAPWPCLATPAARRARRRRRDPRRRGLAGMAAAIASRTALAVPLIDSVDAAARAALAACRDS